MVPRPTVHPTRCAGWTWSLRDATRLPNPHPRAGDPPRRGVAQADCAGARDGKREAGNHPPLRTDAAREAGMSPHQAKQAARVAQLAGFMDFVAEKAEVGGGGRGHVVVANMPPRPRIVLPLCHLAPLLCGVVFLGQTQKRPERITPRPMASPGVKPCQPAPRPGKQGRTVTGF